MKIDIYIKTKWKGTFSQGEGAYGIVLQILKNGTPYTKEHYAGWENLSLPKLQLRSVVDAIAYVNRPCEICIHTDSAYVTGTWSSKNNNGKYMELWETFKKSVEKMEKVELELDGKHEYASYLKRKLDEGGYPTIKDQ